MRAESSLETMAMRLNHIDLAVPDIAVARDFFETHLGFTHQQTLGQNGLSILRDEGGLVLVLSRLQRKRRPGLSGRLPHRLPPGKRGGGAWAL